MVYRQSKAESAARNELRSVLRLGKYVAHTTPVATSPFLQPNVFLRLKRSTQQRFVVFIEKVIGRKLYIEDDKALLYQLPPETRSLLGWLISNRLLSTWNFGRPLLSVSSIKTMYLFPEPITTPEGGFYTPSGANGIGTGSTFASAAVSALGEFIERNASAAYWWENRGLYKASFCLSSTQIDPSLFNIFGGEVAATNANVRQYTSTDELYWVPAKNVVDARTVHVPASVVYMYFRQDYPSEPFLRETSSNGAATFINYEEAATRAILELIERHVFIRSWYHKKSGNRISLASLEEVFPELTELQKSLSDQESVAVYELTDFLGVPTFMATLMSTNPERTAVNVTAAADLDAHSALQKTIKELIRFAEEQYPVKKEQQAPFDVNATVDLQNFANSLTRRRLLWSYQEMLTHLEWLKDAPMLTYSQIQKLELFTDSHSERYSWLRNRLKETGVTVYMADVTNSVARHAGLVVVRAISPDMIPMFFNEQYLPLNSTAFTSDENGGTVQLNPIPHPFI